MLEVIIFIVLFFLVGVLWTTLKKIKKDLNVALKWLAHMELLLKEKGIWEFKDDSLKDLGDEKNT